MLVASLVDVMVACWVDETVAKLAVESVVVTAPLLDFETAAMTVGIPADEMVVLVAAKLDAELD